MRFSKLYAPTTKEAPKDASLPSHKYLIRGGFIQQLGSGLYNFLPLGQRVYHKIHNIVKEEMDKSGALEVNMSFVTPSELWKESGRFDAYGKELLRLKDRKDNDFILAPTHEESITNMIRFYVKSYKQLPLHLYQITSKFRDEARPRFGLLRGREFVMKDGYSFHDSKEDLIREFNVMQDTYSKIFTRLGLDFRIVEADSGAIGGSGSKEFMVLAKSGEDDIITCTKCDYTANVEVANRAKKTSDIEPPQAEFAKFHTPKQNTIKAVSEYLKIDSFYSIKAVIKKAIFKEKEEIIVFFIRGCDELQEVKALNACGALDLADANEEEIKKANLVVGYCGPLKLPSGVLFFIDKELENEENLVCGANEVDYHFVGAKIINFQNTRFKDLIKVTKEDKCPKCGGNLRITKGIEVGHIFQLGTKYSEPMNATFLDKNGKLKPYFMGCYGIGVSRLVAVMIESFHDEFGCIWNKQTAPYHVNIIISNIKDKEQVSFATALYEDCLKRGYEVILDDRDLRFGVKMKDNELIGFPYSVIVGKSLNENEIEIMQRKNLKKEKINKNKILSKIDEWLRCSF